MWRFDDGKLLETLDLIEPLVDTEGPGHQYVDLNSPVDLLILSVDEYTHGGPFAAFPHGLPVPPPVDSERSTASSAEARPNQVLPRSSHRRRRTPRGWIAVCSSAMVRSVQSARHQSLLAFVRRLDPTARHPRACRPAFRQAVPHAVDGVQRRRRWAAGGGDPVDLRPGPGLAEELEGGQERADAPLRQDNRRHRPPCRYPGRSGTTRSTGWRPIIARVPFEQAVLLTKTG